MNNIHVLHILNSAHGGSAISTFELIEALEQRGIKSSLVCFNNANADQRRAISQLVNGRVLFIPLYWLNKRIRSAFWKRPVIEMMSLWKTWGGYRYQSEIASMIKRDGVTVIHTSTILNPEGAIAARRNGLPHVWHVRELVGEDQHYKFYNYKGWANFVLTHSNYLIANSGVTQQCLLKFFPSDRILCIPNGIRIQQFPMKVHTDNRQKIIVGMVGSLTTRWKNHEFFIRSAALFLDHPAIEFRIYGSIPDESDVYYRRIKNIMQSLGVEKKLRLVSFKSPQEIMREIDVMFHPSEFESFGRIYVEAMASGIPVVAVQAGGALEIIQSDVNGFLVKNGDVQEAYRAVNALCGDASLRSKFGARGRKMAEANYSLEQLAARMTSLYHQVQHTSSAVNIT